MCVCVVRPVAIFMHTVINFMHTSYVQVTYITKCRVRAWFALAVISWQITWMFVSLKTVNSHGYSLFTRVILVFNSALPSCQSPQHTHYSMSHSMSPCTSMM